MKHLRFFSTVLLPVIFLASVLALKGDDHAVYLTAVMKNQEFDNNLGFVFSKRTAQDANRRINLRLPELLVFDPSGTLIYSGTTPVENADFLRHLPQSAVGKGKVDGLLQKDEIFSVVPEFAKVKSAAHTDHHYLVFSVTQYPAHIVCAPQDSAVRDLGKPGNSLKIDVLQVALDMK